MLARRNAHLSKVLGMEYDKSLLDELNETKAVVVASSQLPTQNHSTDTDIPLEQSLKDNEQKLESMFDVAKGVLEQSAETATEFQKSRDVEAFANLLGKMTELGSAIVDIKEKRLTKGKNDKLPHTVNQTNITIQNTRQLNEILKGKLNKPEEETPNE